MVEERHVALKMKAMEEYKTEFDIGRRPEDLRIKAQARGLDIATAFAEAFVLGRLYL